MFTTGPAGTIVPAQLPPGMAYSPSGTIVPAESLRRPPSGSSWVAGSGLAAREYNVGAGGGGGGGLLMPQMPQTPLQAPLRKGGGRAPSTQQYFAGPRIITQPLVDSRSVDDIPGSRPERERSTEEASPPPWTQMDIVVDPNGSEAAGDAVDASDIRGGSIVRGLFNGHHRGFLSSPRA